MPPGQPEGRAVQPAPRPIHRRPHGQGQLPENKNRNYFAPGGVEANHRLLHPQRHLLRAGGGPDKSAHKQKEEGGFPVEVFEGGR